MAKGSSQEEIDQRAMDQAAAPPRRTDGAAAELQSVRARLEEARKIRPQGKELHCGDCWRRGRDAAIRLIEGLP
jgi:hypothetical protein